RPVSTSSGVVLRTLSRMRPAAAPPTIGITMIKETRPRILTSPLGVGCAISGSTQSGRTARVYRRPLNTATGALGSATRCDRAPQALAGPWNAGYREAVRDGGHTLHDAGLGGRIP